jgi:hypothetical protein
MLRAVAKRGKLKKIARKVVRGQGDVPPPDTSFAEIAKDSMLAGANFFDDDATSLGDASVGDDDASLAASMGSMGASVGSLGDASLVSAMEPIHVTTQVQIARAMERFNKRKQAYENKQLKATKAAAVLMTKIKEREEKPKKLRMIRKKKEAKQVRAPHPRTSEASAKRASCCCSQTPTTSFGALASLGALLSWRADDLFLLCSPRS